MSYSSVKQFTILPPLSFIADVRKEAAKAQKRIYLQAMEVEPGPIANHLLEVLETGAEKKLDTKLHVDNYSLMVTDGVFNYVPIFSQQKRAERRERLKKRIGYFDQLQAQGVQITFTNHPGIQSKLFPVFGRNHMKIAVVDDVAYIGGINYHDANFRSNDCMIKLTDPRLVNPVVDIFTAVEKGILTEDKKIPCTETSTLLVDSGKVGKSLILNQAVQLINEAEESVTLITPIIPDTRLLRALSKSKKRNVHIQVIVPAVQRMMGVYLFLDTFNQFSLSLQFKHIPILYKKLDIHAKMITIDNKKVLLGSHNLTNRGVMMGTEELAIISTDDYFVSQAKAFINHVISH